MGDTPAPSPIAIAGMHRSGTSMITRGLHDAGLHLIGSDEAELIDAAEDNPEGFWENKAIVRCNDDLLEAAGGSWDNPPDLPPLAVDDPRVAHLAGAATEALAGLRQHDHWGFKDPRLCLTAAYWLDLQPDLKFIICLRHPLEVALSLKRRNQNSYSLGLALWEHYYAAVLEQVPADRRLVTHYDTFFDDPEGELARLCRFSGLEPGGVHVRTDLRHHTIDVSLEDAGTTDRLRGLYAQLCREAGVPVAPRRRSDERNVRRLVLDGAVAERHAEQRQAAIDRLQERETEFRAEIHQLKVDLGALRAEQARERSEQARARSELEARHRLRVRELEVELATIRAEGPEITLLREIAGSVRRTEAQLAGVDARTKVTFHRIEKLVRVAKGGRYGRALRRRAAPLLRRGRSGAVKLGSTSTGSARRTVSQAGRQLPPPARRALRSARAVARDPRRQAVPAARSVVRRLPPPAQHTLRRTLQRSRVVLVRASRTVPGGARLGRLASLGRPAHLDQPEVVAPKAPKGPAPRLWLDDYRTLIANTLAGGEHWAVVTPGCSADVQDVARPAGTEFPPGGKPLAADIAHIAALEALRYDGATRLVVPEGARGFLAQQVVLGDHLHGHHRVEVDQPGAGLVFALDVPARAGGRPLGVEVRTATAALDRDPSVLDWTSPASGLNIAAALPGLATFRAPEGIDSLPFPDDVADVVVVTADRDLAEAARASAGPVVVVQAGASGAIEVRSVQGVPDRSPAGAAPTLLWTPSESDRWQAALHEVATVAGASVIVAPLDAGGLDDFDPSPGSVVVLVEPGSLPLPGAIEQAARLVTGRPEAAAVGKVLRADGTLESAGGMVFADRSVGLIGYGSVDVSGPWHDYVRPVCWGSGLLAVDAARLLAVGHRAAGSGRAYLRELAGELWAAGTGVTYHPDLASVRVVPDPGEPSMPMEASTWQRVLDLRPQRPAELSDGAWRYLLANDDVQACGR